MIRLIVLGVVIFFQTVIHAQEIIHLSKSEAEALFLKQNLNLLSEQLAIESQKANVIQARLWPNPEFAISEINLWENHTVEPSPPFFNDFGRNQQVAFEINQLIQTAGKRKKLIALEEIDVSKKEHYFENLLTNLKFELRHLLADLHYVQQMKIIYQNLINSITTLLQAYQNQLDQGYISNSEFIRLKAEELQIHNEILELNKLSNDTQKALKMLLRLPPSVQLHITDEGFDTHLPSLDNLTSHYINFAKENRPDYQLAIVEETYAKNQLSYEKALRIPDVTFGVNYDRNGSTMLDFVGVKLSLELPVFDRNKGNILRAEINIEKAQLEREQTKLKIQNQVIATHQTLQQAINFYQNIDENHENELDSLLENYTQNFRSKNISLLEYVDFLNTYVTNKKILLDVRKDIEITREEFYYVLGNEF